MNLSKLLTDGVYAVAILFKHTYGFWENEEPGDGLVKTWGEIVILIRTFQLSTDVCAHTQHYACSLFLLFLHKHRKPSRISGLWVIRHMWDSSRVTCRFYSPPLHLQPMLDHTPAATIAYIVDCCKQVYVSVLNKKKNLVYKSGFHSLKFIINSGQF